MKIIYVMPTLAGKGGAERIVSEKMSYLADNLGYDIIVVTCYQMVSQQDNAYPLSDKVKQIDLCIPYHTQYRVGYPKRLFAKWSFARDLKHKLTEIVKQQNPDVLVGMGYINADILCNIDCRAAKVIEAHEARPYTLRLDGDNSLLAVRLFMKFYRWYYFHEIERKATVVVTLTQGDAQLWKKAQRVEVIPNFSTMTVSRLSLCNNKRVLSVGRLDWQKGYDLLLESWALVEKRHPEWHLDIFGEGQLETELKNIIKKLNLKTVKIFPFTSNISKEYADSSIVVLSSRFEGFSLVLLEALRHGVPCVSFDCMFGPSDVLDNGKCGILVPVGDVSGMANKICYLIENNDAMLRFREAAIEQANNFCTDIIMQKWDSLFHDL